MSSFQSESTKRVLLVAYYFPPLGMGVIQRIAKWAKYFLRLDWEVTVITIKPIVYLKQNYPNPSRSSGQSFLQSKQCC
jgi:hypothetical protein